MRLIQARLQQTPPLRHIIAYRTRGKDIESKRPSELELQSAEGARDQVQDEPVLAIQSLLQNNQAIAE